MKYKIFELATNPAVLKMKERDYSPPAPEYPFVLAEVSLPSPDYNCEFDTEAQATSAIERNKEHLRGSSFVILPYVSIPYID